MPGSHGFFGLGTHEFFYRGSHEFRGIVDPCDGCTASMYTLELADFAGNLGTQDLANYNGTHELNRTDEEPGRCQYDKTWQVAGVWYKLNLETNGDGQPWHCDVFAAGSPFNYDLYIYTDGLPGCENTDITVYSKRATNEEFTTATIDNITGAPGCTRGTITVTAGSF